LCATCGGTGWRIARRDGVEVATRCDCRTEKASASRLAACRIPPRYEHCSIDSFELWEGEKTANHLQSKAKRRAAEFVSAWPALEHGLLFQGPAGTGKTHLAVAALKELALRKGVRGLYVNSIQLVQELQLAFDNEGRSREAILGPVTGAELLVLDELGGGKVREWVTDLLYYVINSRYMNRRLTIFTTNFLDSGRGAQEGRGTSTGPEPSGVERWRESLADRISDRLRSRLYEMCETVDLQACHDFRKRESDERRLPGRHR
jgi:DNA replication protein DnaC